MEKKLPCLPSSELHDPKGKGSRTFFFFLFPHIAAAFAAACSAVHRAERVLATFLHFTYPSSVAIETCLYHRPFVPILQQCGPIPSYREGQNRALQFGINEMPTGGVVLGTFVPATPGAPGYCSAHTHTSPRTYMEPGAQRYILQVWPGDDIHATWRYRSPLPCRGTRDWFCTAFPAARLFLIYHTTSSSHSSPPQYNTHNK